MKDQLAEIAQKDTPKFVDIPSTWSGIVAWGIARFGIGVIGFYAAWIVYSDMKIYNERVLVSYERASITQAEMRSTLEQYSRILERIEQKLLNK